MNPLLQLLSLSLPEQQQRGIEFTPGEIVRQPSTWLDTYRLFETLEPQLKSFIAPMLEEQCIVYLVGAGSSDYVGLSVADLIRRTWQREVVAVASTNLLTNREDLILPQRRYLWIHFSRSGDSPEGVAVLDQALALSPNVRHLVVSCNEDGLMVRMARADDRCMAVVLNDDVNDRGLAMTSSFTNMLVFGQALAHLWDRGNYPETLASMCEAAEYLLDEGATIACDLAARGYSSACFVGAGGLSAAARESALKSTELTSGATRAFSESTLGLRHGPMSSLNMDTLFVILLSQAEPRRRYDADLLAEVHRKQVVPTIVAIGGLKELADKSLYHPSFEGIADAYRPAVDVIFGQMFGLFASIEEGLKPDSPSPGGVISRVVEKFTIYA